MKNFIKLILELELLKSVSETPDLAAPEQLMRRSSEGVLMKCFIQGNNSSSSRMFAQAQHEHASRWTFTWFYFFPDLGRENCPIPVKLLFLCSNTLGSLHCGPLLEADMPQMFKNVVIFFLLPRPSICEDSLKILSRNAWNVFRHC